MDASLIILGLFLFCYVVYFIYSKSKTKTESRTLNFLKLKMPLLEDLHCDRCGEQVARQRATHKIIIDKRLYWSWTCPKCVTLRLEAYNEGD